ncbi:polysaccharide deacetylase family protein [Pendulispora rubella]|uniref:Polysaccharide deacetylase family protein n=1 Tax=Pendulispora rubella TaxID=2741070 RepID=A0ABZ2L3X3_9BACT
MPPFRLLLYAASLGAVLFSVRAVLIATPPLWVSACLALTYVGLILGGVFVLRLRAYVDAIIDGPPGARGVVLTFDDGPDPDWTPRVLDMLERSNAVATFFVIGKKAEQHPQLVREILARGHSVGLHSYAHDRLFSLRSERHVRDDLAHSMQVLADILGESPMLFRPPIGHTNPIIARVADAMDLTVVGWSVSGHDGLARADAEQVVRRIRRGLRDGAIVLLHDASERGTHEPAGVKALPAVLAAITDAQLPVVPLQAFLGEECEQ